MNKKIKKITVVGDGGWGTTLAIHLAKKNRPVVLWGPFPEYVREIKKTRHNRKFLPGVKIPSGVRLESSLARAIHDGDLIVLAVPSQYVSAVLKQIRKTKIKLSDKIFLSVVKGIEAKTLLRISQMMAQALGKVSLAVLSGPNISREVARGVPSTAVIASKDPRVAKELQKIFNSKTFRIYTNTDVAGVEFGGSLKNIIAIACGVCDGLGFGSNTKAAIVTRGLAEMARLGQALGARKETFSGLSGLGDLVTTCFSPQSRNRTVGEQLGKGKSIKHIVSHMEMVAEGVETVKAACELSRKHKIPMPITHQVYQIIYRRKKPLQAVTDLMARKTKAE